MKDLFKVICPECKFSQEIPTKLSAQANLVFTQGLKTGIMTDRNVNLQLSKPCKECKTPIVVSLEKGVFVGVKRVSFCKQILIEDSLGLVLHLDLRKAFK